MTVQQMVDQVMALDSGTRINLLAPIVSGRKGEYQKELQNLVREGYARVKVDGTLLDLLKRSSWTRRRSIPSRSWWIALWSRRA